MGEAPPLELRAFGRLTRGPGARTRRPLCSVQEAAHGAAHRLGRVPYRFAVVCAAVQHFSVKRSRNTFYKFSASHDLETAAQLHKIYLYNISIIYN
jgi:hypothetical protein